MTKRKIKGQKREWYDKEDDEMTKEQAEQKRRTARGN